MKYFAILMLALTGLSITTESAHAKAYPCDAAASLYSSAGISCYTIIPCGGSTCNRDIYTCFGGGSTFFTLITSHTGSCIVGNTYPMSEWPSIQNQILNPQ